MYKTNNALESFSHTLNFFTFGLITAVNVFNLDFFRNAWFLKPRKNNYVFFFLKSLAKNTKNNLNVIEKFYYFNNTYFNSHDIDDLQTFQAFISVNYADFPHSLNKYLIFKIRMLNYTNKHIYNAEM